MFFNYHQEPWWTTGLKTHSEHPNFDPDLVSYVARTTVSRARVAIGDILEKGRNSNAEENLSIYGDEALSDDMFVTAARVQVSISTTHVYGDVTKKTRSFYSFKVNYCQW